MEIDPRYQHTLAGAVNLSGVGLHTGVPVSLELRPAPANTGIVFKRTDLEDFPIKASVASVARVAYATSLMRRGVLISTTEHLLSALAALGVDNVYAEMNNIEVPILDGSSLPIAQRILGAGLKRQRARRAYLQITRPLEITDGEKRIGVYPSRQFRATCGIDFPHPLIGKQAVDFLLSPETYIAEIAPARTFITLEEVEPLRGAGLVRGGSLENAIVLGPDGVLNPEGLRFPDEFCRHKALDLIGDLALLGHPVIGHVMAHRGGHALHYSLATRLLKERGAWKLVDASAIDHQTSAA